LLVAAAAALALDQASKSAVRARFGPAEVRSVLGDCFKLRRVENAGVAFGLLSSAPGLAKLGVSLAPLLIAALATQVRGPLAAPALGLIVGGWAGNALDRFRRGTVTDFLDLGLGRFRWPTFNLADSAVVLGVLLLALGSGEHSAG
jgi:signal peptidase II